MSFPLRSLGPVVMMTAVILLPSCWTGPQALPSILETTNAMIILTHGGATLQELARICSTLQDQLVIAEVRHPAIVGSKSVANFDRGGTSRLYTALNIDD